LPIKYQADADLDFRVVRGLKRIAPEIDFCTAIEADLDGRPDPEVLRIASEAGRILVTNDRRTMPGHFRAFVLTHHSPGVFVVRPNVPIGDLIQELLLIWNAGAPEEFANHILWLPL
jgi:hypothetical protein